MVGKMEQKKISSEIEEKTLNFFTTAKFLWSYMDGLKKHYLLFYFCWLFHTVTNVVSPLIFGEMIDSLDNIKELTEQFQKGGIENLPDK